MTFPHSTDHQLITNMANSAREVMALTPDTRRGDLAVLHATRVHELMRFRTWNSEY